MMRCKLFLKNNQFVMLNGVKHLFADWQVADMQSGD